MGRTKRNIPPLKPEDKGKCFTRRDLELPRSTDRKSHVEFEKEKYLFITINNGKYLNELHMDGVVHEPSKSFELADYCKINNTLNKDRHIMVRFLNKGNLEYEYIGDEQYIFRFDKRRNKIIVG